MAQVADKEAELKAQVKDLKAKVSAVEQANGVLSKQAGSAETELRKLADLKEELKELKKTNANLEADNSRLAAEVYSLQAQAEEADKVLAVAKDLKSLLAKV